MLTGLIMEDEGKLPMDLGIPAIHRRQPDCSSVVISGKCILRRSIPDSVWCSEWPRITRVKKIGRSAAEPAPKKRGLRRSIWGCSAGGVNRGSAHVLSVCMCYSIEMLDHKDDDSPGDGRKFQPIGAFRLRVLRWTDLISEKIVHQGETTIFAAGRSESKGEPADGCLRKTGYHGRGLLWVVGRPLVGAALHLFLPSDHWNPSPECGWPTAPHMVDL